MLEVSNDTEDTNSPFDDVTHWVGHLPRKNNDSVKRTVQRNLRRKIEPNILSKKLGVEKKRQAQHGMVHRFFTWRYSL